MKLAATLREQFKKGSNLLKLIYINSALFLVFALLKIITVLFRTPDLEAVLLGYLAAPASPSTLMVRPWTLVTYMFLHTDFFHLLFNMLWLWWFGKIFIDYFNQKRIVPLYLAGGLAGSLLYVIAFNLFPGFADYVDISIALGASAAVMAIVIATAVYVPDYTIYLLFLGPVKIKWVALAIFLLTSLVDFSVNSGGKIAHIGGAAFGYFYAVSYRNGKDLTRGLNRLLDSVATWFKPKPAMKVTYKKPMSDYEYNKTRTEHQEKINKILEKISRGGYDSLTREEKEILFRESQKKN